VKSSTAKQSGSEMDAKSGPAKQTGRETNAEPNSAKPLVAIWLSLLALLAVTVVSAYVPMGAFNTVVNLAIAAAKALLVLIFFMHLREASAAIRLIAAAGFFWLAILLGISLADFFARVG
jgi:cytochrome c oxidase subunit 4